MYISFVVKGYHQCTLKFKEGEVLPFARRGVKESTITVSLLSIPEDNKMLLFLLYFYNFLIYRRSIITFPFFVPPEKLSLGVGIYI